MTTPRLASVAAIALAALGTACASGSTTSSASAADAAFYGGGIQVGPATGSTLPLTKIDEIKHVAGVKTAFATYRFDAGTGRLQPAGIATTDSIVASDPTEAAWSGLKTDYAQGHAIDADSSGEVVLGAAIANEFRKKIGDSIELPANPAGGAARHSFTVVGVLGVTNTGPDRFAYVNITDGQMLLKDSLSPGQIQQVDVAAVATAIDVYAKSGTTIDELDKIADQINQQVAGVIAIKPSRLVDSLKHA